VEIEKTLTVAAPQQRVWDLLLDPQVMGGCVPGMKSVDVVSDVEYVALMHVKISFINAKFKLRTTIVEQREPSYLRTEGTGEDASVASSLKQRSEIFLTPTAEGGTELRIKVNVDVLGRLGTFGLGVMKTKADRMWEEFGTNLAARIDGGAAPVPAANAPKAAAPSPAPMAKAAATQTPAAAAPPSAELTPTAPRGASQTESSWWSRWLNAKPGRAANIDGSGRFIRIEVRQPDKTINVDWPVEHADQCKDWLRDLVR